MFEKIKQRYKELNMINEMEQNNIVIGVYYYSLYFDEYFLGSEMISKSNFDNPIGVQAFSIDCGDYLIPLQESTYMYEKFQKCDYNFQNNQDVIAVSKKIDWNKLETEDINYIYGLYTTYMKYKKQQNYQKVK